MGAKLLDIVRQSRKPLAVASADGHAVRGELSLGCVEPLLDERRMDVPAEDSALATHFHEQNPLLQRYDVTGPGSSIE